MYKTKDLHEAAYIHSQKILLNSLERVNTHYFFVFDNEEKCILLSQAYWSQQAEGNIKAYADSLRTLKDLIFSEKGKINA